MHGKKLDELLDRNKETIISDFNAATYRYENLINRFMINYMSEDNSQSYETKADDALTKTQTQSTAMFKNKKKRRATHYTDSK